MAERNDRRTRTSSRGSASRMSSRPTPRKATSDERGSSRSTRAGRNAQKKASRQSAMRRNAREANASTRSRSSQSLRNSQELRSSRDSLDLYDSRSSRETFSDSLASRDAQASRAGRADSSYRTSRYASSTYSANEVLPGQRPRAKGSTRFTDGLDVPNLSDEQTLFALPGGLYDGSTADNQAQAEEPEFVSTSVGELRRRGQAERNARIRKSSRNYLMRLVAIVGVVVVLLAGWAALYNSPAFTIENVQVNGVSHLTDAEMSQLANIPDGMTLLRVDTDAVRSRLMQTAWVQDAEVKRVFPNTLELDVTERSVQAIVEIPTSTGSTVKNWAISEDHIWLMPIPDADSEAAKTTSAQIYADAKEALHIVDVPYGTKAEIGQYCSDSNVNNALDIVNGMTTELAGRVVKVKAAGPAETTLVLDNGVEIAFGKAEDIRDKERVILKILEENPDGVAYINVRMVEQPTWRAV